MSYILKKKNDNNVQLANLGFSTVEMLIAMAILVIFLSAIILVSFGSQSLLVDSQTSSEATNIAQEFLEKEQALARKDFKLVVPVTGTQDIYNIKIDVVATSSDPNLVYFTKKVTATVSWPDQYNRGLNVKLSALITNFENAVGGDTCSSVLSGNWQSPDITVIPLPGNTNTGASLSVDAYKQKLYAAVSDADATDTPTIFVYSLEDPKNPSFITSLDNADIKAGINAIQATDKYLYAAKATGPASGQLQIFDILGATPVQEGYDFTVDGAMGTGGQAIGNSIFYKDGYVYLGLTATASGPEFHIIDVHSSSNPFEVGYWPQAGNLGSAINAIYVKGKYVYLATADSKDLIVLDITNPTSPNQIGDFDISGGGHGKSFYLVGDSLYLGRTIPSSRPEFYNLNISDPADISTSSSQEISSSVNGIVVRDYLAYLITTDSQFQIWKIDSSLISSYTTPLALPSGSVGNSLDCEGNYFYAGSVDSSNKGYLSVISAP